jgi:hypothetical protein
VKLRIRDNSLRLRLAKSEVASLDAGGAVEASIEFPGGVQLGYSACLLREAPAMTASFRDNVLCVAIPEDMGRAWAQSEEISLFGVVELNDAELTILVEKDFACLTPREGEDESDLYPHPEQGQAAC